MLNLFVRRGSHALRCSITDRRDFYHQAHVTDERARTNMIPFSFSVSELAGFRALEIYKEELQRKKGERKERALAGDRLGMKSKEINGGSCLFPSFGALFQGDHLGVEFALEGHQNLLKREGLLIAERRLQGGEAFPLDHLVEGLIIDDFFVIEEVDKNMPKEQTNCFLLLQKAREAYRKHGLPGSVEKDVVAEDKFKAAGAECDSTRRTLGLGLCLLGSPLGKRIGLSCLSLRLARLPLISSKVAARVAGNWISCLLFRRCLSSVVDDLFALGSTCSLQEEEVYYRLSRRVSMELAHLAILAPLMVSDLSAPMSGEVVATDASLAMGAIVSKDVDEELARELWRRSEKKGTYTKLSNGFKSALLAAGVEDEDEDADCGPVSGLAEIERPPSFEFDFLEVCGGVGRVSQAMSELGHVVAPVLDLSNSRHYNLSSLGLLNWLIHMLASGRVKSIMCEPPCTTFSAAAHPACRSYRQPEGWNRRLPKVFRGNQLAFRSLILCLVAKRHKRPSGLEQPRLSKMAWLRAWKWLLKVGFQEAVIAMCHFGSIHRKEFRILISELDPEMLTAKCLGGHQHVRIEGSYTKDSAIYTEGMAMHLAKEFSRVLRKLKIEERDELRVDGKESVVVNDLLMTGGWTVVRQWFWKGSAHINLLETSVFISVLREAVVRRPGCRLVGILDSGVAIGALAKGRSSSRALQPYLRKGAALQIAGNLYPGLCFGPTRLNVADDPSRGVALRSSSHLGISDFLRPQELQLLNSRCSPRYLAGWTRLTFLVVVWNSCHQGAAASNAVDLSSQTSSLHTDLLLSLGFSWFLLAAFVLFCLSQLLSSRVFRSSLFLLAMAALPLNSATLVPESAAETERAHRRSNIVLASDRVLRQETRNNREKLLLQFRRWVETEGGDWNAIFGRSPLDPEEICSWLTSYGRDLHSSGKSYGRYSETINAIGSLRPIIKRQLTAAWDLAYAWLIDEPHQHHPALPQSILVAVITLGLLWGWPVESSIFGMCWAGLMRIGEILEARRSDVTLPCDAAPGVDYVLIRIREPKTRGRGARHQCARVDPSDLVSLITATFKNYSPEDPIWPFSPATLRRRFCQLLQSIGLPTKTLGTVRPYDLGSLRAGGATWMLGLTEDSSLVQRRGRWLAYRVMTIYLQEIQVVTAVPRLDPAVRKVIEDLNSVFPEVLNIALQHLRYHIPFRAWFLLFRHSS